MLGDSAAELRSVAKRDEKEAGDVDSRVAQIDNQQPNGQTAAAFFVWKHLLWRGLERCTASRSGGKTPSLRREKSASDSSEKGCRREARKAGFFSWIRCDLRRKRNDRGVRSSWREQRSSSCRSTHRREAMESQRLQPISCVCSANCNSALRSINYDL